jgi:HEAT repeat protein
MVEPTRPQLAPSSPQPSPGQVHFSQWNADDDPSGGGGTPGGPGGGGAPGGGDPGGGSFPGSAVGEFENPYDLSGAAGDGNFKRGAHKPVVIVGGLLAAAALAAGVFFGMKQDAEKIPPEKAAVIKQELLVMPLAEQLPRWREYAKGDKSSYLKQEALKQLAWARDPEGVPIAIEALGHVEQHIRAHAAMVLAEYDSPMADGAKPVLVKAMAEAGPESAPQIGWAMVELGEPGALDRVLQLYRAGHLSTVRRLDGNVAFSPEKLVDLIGIDKLAEMHSDESPAVRQLVATVLSRRAEPKYADALIKLLNDGDGEISRQAAPGLGKIGDQRALEPLLEKLRGADADSRTKYLQALRDGVGAKGLVLSLASISQDDRTRWWHRTNQTFEMTRKLADPRGGDPLQQYIESEPHIHWELQSAFALAEVGDLRAVPVLARRMRMDANKIYGDETDYEQLLKRNNNERTVAARMLADLAVLHPEAKDSIRQQAEDAVIFWIHEMPSPHANGLRALAAMGSTKDIKALRDWANPKAPLPLEGQQPPMPEEWVIAQSALRYLGMMKDEPSWSVLTKQLTRRDKKLDVTMDGLMSGGLAILGMSLRAIGVGAAQGLAEWRDPKAVKPLMDYIDEPKENEQSRMEACAALAWVATDDDMAKVAEKVKQYDGGKPQDEVIRACYLETLITRPVADTAPALLELMKPESSLATRHQVARALGKAGLDEATQQKLIEMMNDEVLMVDATLALILGGSAETAARTIAMWVDKPKEALDELQDLWFKSFGYWSHEDLNKGHIFRWVQNAEAISRTDLKDTPQEWASELLRRQFDNLEFDNGPHSFTRVVLRYRLMQMAEGNDAIQKKGAIDTLRFMKEQGVLLALRDKEGEVGKLASEAYHLLMNPKAVRGVISTKDEDHGSRE